jgi:hypothetical protein
MRRTLLLLALPLVVVLAASAQQSAPDPFAPLSFLVGDWGGEGGGQPGQASAGRATFEYQLQKHAIVRKSFSEYPATKDRSASRHEDLMVIFEEGGVLKATYWDNEGHVIRYVVTSPVSGEVVFLSEAAPGPRFRLTYTKVSDKQHTVVFEMARPGSEKFEKYVEGKAVRLLQTK